MQFYLLSLPICFNYAAGASLIHVSVFSAVWQGVATAGGQIANCVKMSIGCCSRLSKEELAHIMRKN